MARLLRKLVLCSKTDTISSRQGGPPDPSSEGAGTQQQQSVLECAVCQEPASKPCTVPCGNSHVFCQVCLQGILTHGHHRSSFPCPLCRRQIRVPLGGVAAFRQNKFGRGLRILQRMPVFLPGRCRRRRRGNSSSNNSSFDIDNWLDGFDAVIVGGGGGGGGEGWSSSDDNNDEDDNDDDDDDDVFERPIVPRYGCLLGHVPDLPNLAFEREQGMILESFQWRRRQLAQHLAGRGLENQDEAGAASGEVVDERGGGGEDGGSSSWGELAAGLGSDSEGVPVSELFASPDDDLDMRVVLQIIHDMENNNNNNNSGGGNSSSSSSDNLQAGSNRQPPPSAPTTTPPPPPPPPHGLQGGEEEEDMVENASSNSPPACPQTTPQGNTNSEVPAGAGSLSSCPQHERGGGGDWKLMTIADTSIPRPRLNLSSMSEDIDPQEEDGLQLAGPGRSLHSRVSCSAGEETNAHPCPAIPQLTTGALGEGREMLRVDHLPLQESANNTCFTTAASLEESSDRDVHRNPSRPSPGLKPNTGSAVHHHPHHLSSELPLLDNLQGFSSRPLARQGENNAPQGGQQTDPALSRHSFGAGDRPPTHHHHHHHQHHRGDHPQSRHRPQRTASGSKLPGPAKGDLSPEDWRHQQLHRLQHAQRTAARQQGEGEGNSSSQNSDAQQIYPELDTRATVEREVLAEGPDEWMRRIRTHILQQRRKTPSKRSSALTRSHSSGGGGGGGGDGGVGDGGGGVITRPETSQPVGGMGVGGGGTGDAVEVDVSKDRQRGLRERL